MGDIARLTKRLMGVRIFTFFVGFLWVFTTLFMVVSLSRLSPGGNSITAMIVGSAAMEPEAAAASGFSSMIYFVGFVLFGGVLFVVSRYGTELKSVLKIEEDKELFTTTPRIALTDFFKILINWSIKTAKNTREVFDALEQIRQENKGKLPILSDINLTLDGDAIGVSIGADPKWEELYEVFLTYLKELDVDAERFVHISEYLGKNDVGIVLNRIEEVRARATKQMAKEEKKKAKV